MLIMKQLAWKSMGEVEKVAHCLNNGGMSLHFLMNKQKWEERKQASLLQGGMDAPATQIVMAPR